MSRGPRGCGDCGRLCTIVDAVARRAPTNARGRTCASLAEVRLRPETVIVCESSVVLLAVVGMFYELGLLLFFEVVA